MNKHTDKSKVSTPYSVNTNEKMTQKKFKTKFGFSNFPVDESKTKSYIDLDKDSGDLYQHYSEYDSKGLPVNSGCYSLFWCSDKGKSISSEDEKQLRELGVSLNKKLGIASPKESFSFWKSILEKKALDSQSEMRVGFRLIMIGAGFTTKEIRALERMVDKN